MVMSGFYSGSTFNSSVFGEVAYKRDINPGFYGITLGQIGSIPGSGATRFRGINNIKFDGNFYLTQNAPDTDTVIVNIRSIEGGSGGGGVTDHGFLTGLLDDDHTQYIRVDGTRAFTGAQSMGGFRLTNVGEPTAGTDAARRMDIGPGFYGISVKQRNNLDSYKGINTLNFGTDFYLTQNINNTDSVTVEFRGTASGGGSGVSSITLTDGVRTFTEVSTIGFDHAKFYLSRGSDANSAVVNTRFRGAQVSKVGDQSVASGTSNTAVTWEARRYDTEANTADPIWDSGSNTILTVPPGVAWVKITIGINWDNNGATTPSSGLYRQIILLKNGAGFVGSPTNQIAPTFNENTVVNVVSAVLPVIGGDTFSVRANQVSTTATACDILQANATWFAMEIVG